MTNRQALVQMEAAPSQEEQPDMSRPNIGVSGVWKSTTPYMPHLCVHVGCVRGISKYGRLKKVTSLDVDKDSQGKQKSQCPVGNTPILLQKVEARPNCAF